VTYHTVRPQKQETAKHFQHAARIKKRLRPLKRTKPVNDCLLQKKTGLARSNPLPKLNCRHCPLPADQDEIPHLKKFGAKNCEYTPQIIDAQPLKTDRFRRWNEFFQIS
jgi:hypothetical protein